MSFSAPSRTLPFVVTGVLLALLGALATLQWRWIGELNAMERQRMQASLQAAGSRFTEDFDRELTRAFLYLHPERTGGRGIERRPGEDGDDLDARLERVARRYERWTAEAPYPRLVRALYAVQLGAPGAPASQAPVLRAVKAQDRAFPPIAWPEELAAVRSRLVELGGPRGGASEPAAIPGLAADLWVLIVPMPVPRAPPDPERSDAAPAAGRDLLLVELDPATVTAELLPELARRYFAGPGGDDYLLEVVAARDPSQVLFRWDPARPALDPRRVDLQLPMFAVRPFEDLRALWTARLPGGNWTRPPLRPGQRPGQRPERRSRFAGPPRGEAPARGGWTLLARLRDGSLEQVVNAARRRNLGISLGILGLLAATATLLAVTTQRAQLLARQQIEFVAGVSHELNTPLTAIRTAGANLADGVVADPAQVRRYGALVESEGRRLSSMVGQVLEFAGMQSRRRVYRLEPASVAAIVDGALRDSRWLLEEGQIAVEKEVAVGLRVMADVPALQRALQNLIENAVKHGAGGQWLGLRARQASGDEVEISVEDRGPGIRREDLRHLFEPFFRGQAAVAGRVPGSGLGLSLVRHIVEAHGGRVSVESTCGAAGSPAGTSASGTTFRIVLPAASPNPDPEQVPV